MPVEVRCRRGPACTWSLAGGSGTVGDRRSGVGEATWCRHRREAWAVGCSDTSAAGHGGHSRRVAAHSQALASALDLDPAGVAGIRAGALLHDVGKIELPAALVDKPGPLSGSEYAEIRRHPILGAHLVAPLGDERLTAIVRHHHERFDGRGYPDGLQGEEIPLGARLVAVADTFDALTSPRPYRPPMSRRRALILLDTAAGSQLDPTVVEAALRLAAQRWARR